MPLVRDSPVAGTPNGASIYSATAPTRPCRFLRGSRAATEEVLAAMPDVVRAVYLSIIFSRTAGC